MIKRHIRLKEWQCSINETRRPAESYLNRSNGSLVDKDYIIRTDENGFIVSGSDKNNASTLKKIVFLGDSFVENIFVDEGSRFPALVESKLAECICLNGGYSGSTTLQMSISLISKIVNLQPDIVYFVLPSNDSLCLLENDEYWTRDSKRYSTVLPALPETKIVGKGKRQIKTNNLSKVLKLIHHSSEDFDFKLVLCTFPHAHLDYENDKWLKRVFPKQSNFKKISDDRMQINNVIRCFAKEKGINFIDFEKLISNNTELLYDDLHLNKKGSKKVADIILENYKTITKDIKLGKEKMAIQKIKDVRKFKPIIDFQTTTYISLQKNYLYTAVGKAANSTVKHHLYELEYAPVKWTTKSLHDRRCSPLLAPFQLGAAGAIKFINDPNIFKFTFVRNPFSKILSCYLERIARKESLSYRIFLRDVLKEKPGYDVSFEEFVKGIQSQRPYDMNNHWRVQYDETLFDMIDYDFIGKVENFKDDMDFVWKKIADGAELPEKAKDENKAPKITNAQTLIEQYYTEEITQIVRDTFKKDFEVFGYSRDLP